MKKLLVLMLAVLLLLSACAEENGANIEDDAGISVDLQITERFFVAQTNEIYGNPDRYLGSTIRIEGLFLATTFMDEDFHYVIRFTEGCCTATEPIGFELYLGDFAPPVNDAWVDVIGVLGRHVDDRNFEVLRLEVISLTETTERGAEFVSQ